MPTRDMTPIHQRDVLAALTQSELRATARGANGRFKISIRETLRGFLVATYAAN
jgi:hypothetical protein